MLYPFAVSISWAATLVTTPAHQSEPGVPQAFIYALCQTSIRMNLQQFLMWGPSRQMQALATWQPPTVEDVMK